MAHSCLGRLLRSSLAAFLPTRRALSSSRRARRGYQGWVHARAEAGRVGRWSRSTCRRGVRSWASQLVQTWVSVISAPQLQVRPHSMLLNQVAPIGRELVMSFQRSSRRRVGMFSFHTRGACRPASIVRPVISRRRAVQPSRNGAHLASERGGLCGLRRQAWLVGPGSCRPAWGCGLSIWLGHGGWVGAWCCRFGGRTSPLCRPPC